MLRGFGVGGRIALTISGLVALVAVGILVVFPSELYARDVAALEARGVAVAELAAFNAAVGVEFQDAIVIEEALNGAARTPSALQVAVFDGAKRLGTSKVEGDDLLTDVPPMVDATETAVLDGYMLVVTPVPAANMADAMLVARFSTSSIETAWTDAIRTSLLFAVMVFLLGLAASAYVGGSLRRRLAEVADIAREAAEGRLDLDLSDGLVEGGDEIDDLRRSVATMLSTLSGLHGKVARIAAGDLTIFISEEGDLADAMRQMVGSQRSLVENVAHTVNEVAMTSDNITRASVAQLEGSRQQVVAVDDTRTSLTRLAAAAQNISEAANGVRSDADRSRAAADAITERVGQLAELSGQVSIFLSRIREISKKSDVLALNAALEGVHAGDVGRGFMLVANQLQTLNENVLSVVNDIKQLSDRIDVANSAAQLSTAESRAHANATAEAADRIAAILDQTAQETLAANRRVQEIADVARKSSNQGEDVRRVAADLTRLSERLQLQIGEFRIDTQITNAR